MLFLLNLKEMSHVYAIFYICAFSALYIRRYITKAIYSTPETFGNSPHTNQTLVYSIWGNQMCFGRTRNSIVTDFKNPKYRMNATVGSVCTASSRT